LLAPATFVQLKVTVLFVAAPQVIVGESDGFTVTVIVTGEAHCPVAGVKV
jgi:hypothetical protein